MAKARAKRSTRQRSQAPFEFSKIRGDLPPPTPEEMAAWKAQAAELDRSRKTIDRALAIRDGLAEPPWFTPKAAQRGRQAQVARVARAIFSSNELKTLPMPELLKRLGDELERQKIVASSATQRRALQYLK